MLIGETVFVTGAGQGVGEAVARRLVAEGGTRIALADIDAVSAERVAADLRAGGADARVFQMDLSSVDSVREAAAQALAAFGPFAILANCAGVTDRGGILDTTPETFDRIFAINVRGNFFLMQALLPGMIKQDAGVVISISSMLAYGGMGHLTPYSASKAALNLITRNVAHTMRTHRVRAHAINLGWTVTPAEHLTQTRNHGLPEDWAQKEGEKQPFGRLLVPEDASNLVAFLCSDQATMMTGTVIDLEQWVSGVLG